MIVMKTRFAALLAASSLMMPAFAQAQDSAELLTQSAGSFQLVEEAPVAPQTAVVDDKPAVAPTNAPDEVELAALYYYAREKQDDRVAGETARLRLKYPQFEIPKDIFAPVVTRVADETALWKLYDQNDFTGIDAEIIRRKSETPDWTPTADFSEKLGRKKQRVRMTEAAKDKNWTGVIQAGAAIDPATETEVDLLWTLIDAYQQIDLKQELAAVYRGILLRQGDKRLSDAVLVTTLQKATRDFPATEVQSVMENIATTPAIKAALQPVVFGLLRKTVADFNADAKQTEPLSEDRLAPLKASAATDPKSGDLALLGWYYLKIKQPAVSADYFGKALAAQPDAANAKGLYLSLAAQNLDDEAYQVAAAHLQDLSSDPEFLMNALSLRFARPDSSTIDERIVASYSTTILQTLNADHAEILAWYAYNSKQYEASAAWFKKAVEWKTAPARVKGLALSYLRLSDKPEFEALQASYKDAYPDIWAEIKVATPPKGGNGASVVKPRGAVAANYIRNFQVKRYSACASDLSDLKARGQLTSGAALIGGWCYLGLSRLSDARAYFAVALQESGQTRIDAAYGTALVLLRAKLTDEAEALLAAYPLPSAKDREIRTEVYVQRARAAFDQKQYQATLDALNARASLVAESPDLSQLRGWAYYHLGNRTVANQVFRRLSDHMSDAGVRRGLLMTGKAETLR